MLMFYPCETYRRNNYKFCPDCGVGLPQTPCPVQDSDFWKQVEDEALTLGAMLEAYGEVAASNMLACPACNFNNEPDALFCGSCGASLADLKQVAPAAAAPSAPAGGIAAPSGAGGPTCSACGASNEPGAAFCEMCGAGLEASSPVTGVICGACGASNEPGSAFCEMCGGTLSGEAAPDVVPSVPPSAGPACPSCGHLNEPGAAFCEMCGAGLAGAASSSAPGVVALPDPTQEMEFDLGGAGPMDDFNFEESTPASGSGDGKTCNVCGSANPPAANACEVCGSGLD